MRTRPCRATGRAVDVAATRFFVNSTIGLGGWIDIAGEHLDKPFQAEDFGQTLAVWGVDSGPYLVLPLLGPSTVRDTGGLAVEMASDPFNNLWNEGLLDDTDGAGLARVGLTVVDARSRKHRDARRTAPEFGSTTTRPCAVSICRTAATRSPTARPAKPWKSQISTTLPPEDAEDGTAGTDSSAMALPADPAVPAAARRGFADAARLPDAPAPLLGSVTELPPLRLDLPPVPR